MNKMFLIIRREFLTRVKKRSFLLTTFLTPLIIVGFMAVVTLIFSYQGETIKIAVKNDSGMDLVLKSSNKTTYINKTEDLEDLKATYTNAYDGLLYIPKFDNLNIDLQVKYYSEEQISAITKENAENNLARQIKDFKIKQSGITEQQLKDLETNVDIQEATVSINEEGEMEEEEKENNAEIATAIGGALGFFIYMILFIYGSMVMRSVMEEKMNRIVEVMISSVKPFQLMLGKIIGVGGVGLVQFLIWAVLIIGLNFLLGLFWTPDVSSIEMGNTAMTAAESEDMLGEMMMLWERIMSQNWWLILPMSIIYFLGGYLLYSSLFAAVGSAIGDDLTEGQSLTLPITIPVILALYIMFAVIQNPHSNLATFASIFPLFSPIVMPARLTFGPPLWEILVSVVVLIASVAFFVWLSGRIYRVGILMYGKKVSFKEIGKWLFYKD